MGVRVKMSPVPRGEKLEQGWEQDRVMLWATATLASLQLFPLDFLSGGHAGICPWTSRTCLCKHFENPEMVLQTVIHSRWHNYSSVLQLAARVYPTVLFGSTLICKYCIWQLVITLAPKCSFPLPQKPSNATSACLILLQTGLLSGIWIWGTCSHVYLLQ